MSLRTKLLATIAVLGLLLTAVAAVVHSSFTATAGNEGNTFEAGSISLTDNDGAKVLFDVDGLEPASPPVVRCIEVGYASKGELTAKVRLYGETSGALAEHLRLKVVRGMWAGPRPAAGSCGDAFVPQEALFDGTLATFPRAWQDGIQDPHTWEDGDRLFYRLEASLANTDAAQGKSATQAFTFEARTA